MSVEVCPICDIAGCHHIRDRGGVSDQRDWPTHLFILHPNDAVSFGAMVTARPRRKYILETALASHPEVQRLIAEAEARGMERVASKAREYSGHYQQGSDGRNTFILLAEWAEAAALRALKGAQAMTHAKSRVLCKKCKECGGTMRPGIATGQTFTAGTPDFGPDDDIQTMSAGGPGVVVEAMKCEACGWSVSK